MSNPLERSDLSVLQSVVVRLSKEAAGTQAHSDLHEALLMRRLVAIACLQEAEGSYYQSLLDRSEDLARHGQELCRF